MSEASVLMDRIYIWQIGIYDITRKYYLLGRDHLIDQLSIKDQSHVLEIGCGTGRNLIKAAQRWSSGRFYGIDVSTVMLTQAGQSLIRHKINDHIRLAYADALSFNPLRTFKRTHFDRIYFSYTLSMIPNWRDALDHALDLLSPNGHLFVIDFGTQSELPTWFRSLLFWWLSLFHVTPRNDFKSKMEALAKQKGLMFEFRSLYYGYAFIAVFKKDPCVMDENKSALSV